MAGKVARPAAVLSVIETEQPLAMRGHVDLGNFAHGAKAEKFVPAAQCRPAVNVIVYDIVFDPSTGLIFQSGELLTRIITYPARRHEFAAVLARVADPVTTLTDAITFCGFNRHWENYGHWLMQSVPSIAGYSRLPEWDDGVLLVPPMTAGQQRCLALAEIQQPRMAEVDLSRAYRLDAMVVSSLLLHWFAPSPFRQSVFAKMRERAEANIDCTTDHRGIYVTRIDSPNRPMMNESDVIKLMSARGFEIVFPACMDVDQQIAAFATAPLVIGPFGAGMTNLAFCQPLTIAYELMPAFYAFPDFCIIAQQTGLNYFADCHPGIPVGRVHCQRQPWQADLALVSKRLDDILQRTDLQQPVRTAA